MSRAPAITLTAIVLLALTAGCRRVPRETTKLAVAATIFPVADVVRQIGGEHVEVDTLTAAGQSPHHFELTVEQVRKLARARLLVMVGMGLDDWALRYARAADRLVVLKLGEHSGIQPPAEEHLHEEHVHSAADAQGQHDDHGHDHAHGGDPHIWLDPVIMQRLARTIADKLAELDPPNRQRYLERLGGYLAQLEDLDREYRQALWGLRGKRIVTYHQAFTYMADRYGLHVESLYGIGGASGETFAAVQKIVDYVKAHKVGVIFKEPQAPPQRLSELARQTGARVATLDPLGGEGVEGYDSYLAMMRSNLRTLVNELRD